MNMFKKLTITMVVLLASNGLIETALAYEGGLMGGQPHSASTTIYKKNKLNTYYLSVNNYTLSNPNQYFDMVVGESCFLFICTDNIKKIKVKYDSSSPATLSIGYERMLSTGWFSYGGEFYRLSNDYQVEGLTSSKGHLDMNNLLVNCKFHMNPGGSIKPYFGVAGGMTESTLRGAVASTTKQTMIRKYEYGLAYQSENYVIRAGYEVSDNDIKIRGATGNDGQEREVSVDNDLRYSGYYLGVALRM